MTARRFELADRSIHGNIFTEWHVGERWDLNQPQIFEYIARDGGEDLAARSRWVKWGRIGAILVAFAGAPFAVKESPNHSGPGLATVLAGGMAVVVIDLAGTSPLVRDFNAHLRQFLGIDAEPGK